MALPGRPLAVPSITLHGFYLLVSQPQPSDLDAAAQYKLTVAGVTSAGMRLGEHGQLCPGFAVHLPALQERQDTRISFALDARSGNGGRLVLQGTQTAAALAAGERVELFLPDRSRWPGSLRCSVECNLDVRRPRQLLCLLVGVDTYAEGQFLRGAAADVQRIDEATAGLRGATPAATLLDGQATRGAVLERLDAAVARASRGDAVLFYFSGLGTLRSTPQPDGSHLVATCLCAHEARAGSDQGLVSPEDLREPCRRALDRGVTVLVILDCSFWGGDARLRPVRTGDRARRVKYLRTTSRLLSTPERVYVRDHPDKLADFIKLSAALNAGPLTRALSAHVDRTGPTAAAPPISLGSVLDTLHVGAVQASDDGAAAVSARWVDIAHGAQAFGAGIVEAAKKATATRDIDIDRAALQALQSMTREQWATVARQAIELEPRGMGDVVDSVAGGLDASPARRHLLMRSLSDAALVNALLAAEPAKGGWREREAALVLGAGADKERLRQALEELSYQRKLQLLDAQTISGKETKEISEKAAGENPSAEWDPWAVVEDGPVKLQAVGDQLGRVVGRHVDTSEISDAEGEGLAELVREVADSGYSKVIIELSRRASTEMSRALVEAISAARGEDSVIKEYVRSGLDAVESRGLLDLVSLVLHDSAVSKKLCDQQIQVVSETTSRAEVSTATWLPADGNLTDLDSVHAFATVRSIVDAAERVLRGTTGIDKEECMQELEALDEGRSWGERTSKGLRWQAGQRLVVDTRATGVTQPMYSRRAGALLFPLLRCSDGGAAGAVSTSRSMEAVAHTAGHAVLDALRPKWAEGIEERPEGGVLHEAFADLAGLLVGTGTAAVSGAVAAETRCDVRAARVAGRQAAGMAEAVGLSGMRSARSTLTARDVWWPQTGLPRQRAGGRRWSSREVSAMVTSAVWAAIASELARRCRRSRAEGKEGKEGRTGPAEDAAEVLSQLAKQALAALVAACMRPEFKEEAPTLVDFCDALVPSSSQQCDKTQEGFPEALRFELQRRFLLTSQWKKPYPRLAKGSIEHTSATSGRTVECPVSRQLWATLHTGAQQALDDTEDEAGAWEALVETWGRVEREAAGQVFGERRMWRAIVVEAAEEASEEGIRGSVRKLVLSLEYVVGCCNESPSLALWRRVLVAYTNTN
eukprot:m51a1_g10101 hypothetical protein (1161) ;mRNA; f:98223-103926